MSNRADLPPTPPHEAATLLPQPVDPSATLPVSPASGPAVSLQRFGDHELLAEVARGGMGVVYRARQVSLDRIVALKMILAGQLASEADVERFRLEARTAAGLQHPNIVAIHEVGVYEGQQFFSMDFVEGKSLADMVKDSPLPPMQAIRYVQIVAEAIHFAHERGVLHRDLKPSNILVDANDQPRVTDFGLAKQTRDERGLTATGAVLGTPGYMPPEQASGKRGEVGPASDVYSLGAVLYELVTGRPPFRAATPLDTIIQVLSEEPAPPRLLNPAIGRDLETVILKCLAKEPARRYASAQDLADDMQALLDGRPVQARRPGPIERSLRWFRRHRTSAAVAGFSAVAAVLLAFASLVGTEQYHRWQRGWLYLGNQGTVLTGEVLDEAGARVLPRFTVPTEEPLALPAGSYQLRLRGRGFLDEVFQVSIERGKEQTFQVSLAEQRLWEPIAVPRSYECVRAGDRHDILALSDSGVERIHGGTGKVIWQAKLGAKDHPDLAGFRWDWSIFGRPSGRDGYDRQPRLLQRAVDLDRDGTPDLVWASRRQAAVLALSGKDGKVLWCFQAPPPKLAGNGALNQERASTGVVLGVAVLPDLDGDGVPDLAGTFASQQQADGSMPRWIQVLSGRTGKPLWRYDLDPRWFAPPPDGVPFETIWNNTQGIGSSVGGSVRSGSGNLYDLFWGIHTGLPVPYPAAVVRVGGRPALVLVAGDRLVGVDPPTGKPLWPAQPLGFWPERPPQWADLDGDGQDDVLLVAPGDRVAEKVVDGFIPKLDVPHPPRFAGDGQVSAGERYDCRLKLVALSLGTRKLLWQTTFRGYWSWAWYEQPFTWPIVEDLDGDGKPEVIVPTGGFEPQAASGRALPDFLKPEAAVRTGDLEGDTKWSGVQVCDGATGAVRWLRKLSISSRFGQVQQVNRIAVGPALDGSGCRGVFTAVMDGDFFARDRPYGIVRIGNFDKDYDHPVIVLDGLSGKDGHGVWWARMRARSGELTNSPKPSVGPLAWWHTGKADWPQLIVPYVPGSPQDKSVRHTVYFVSSRTGQVLHVGADLRDLRMLDLDGDGISDLLTYRPDQPDAWDQGGKLETIHGRSPEAWRRLGGKWQVAGDLDGDGISDLVTAMPDNTRPQKEQEQQRERDGSGEGPAETRQKKTLSEAISGRTGKLIWRREINDSQPHMPWQDTLYTRLQPLDRDLDGDGVPDLLATGSSNTSHMRQAGFSPLLAVSGRTGRRLWEADIKVETWNGPQLLECRDLDGDGKPEILFVSAMDWGWQRGPNAPRSSNEWQYWLAVLSGRDGKVRWKQPLCGKGRHNAQAAVSLSCVLADLDGDGVQDVIIEAGEPEGAGEVFAFSGVDGKLLWKWAVPPGMEKQRRWNRARPMLAAGDLDGNGKPDILVLHVLRIHDKQGRVWDQAEVVALDGGTAPATLELREPVSNQFNEYGRSRVTPLVVNLGGKRRAVCVWTHCYDKGGQVVLLDAHGKELRRQAVTFRLNGDNWRQSRDNPRLIYLPFYGSLFRVWAVDLDGDGRDELVYFTSDRLRVCSGNLDRVIAEWPLPDEECEMLDVRPASAGHPAVLVVRAGNRVVCLNGGLDKPLWSIGGAGKAVAVAWDTRGQPRVISELDNEVTACQPAGEPEEEGLPPGTSGEDPRFAVALPWSSLTDVLPFCPDSPAVLLMTLLGVAVAVLVLPGAMLVWVVRRRSWRLLLLPLPWLALCWFAAWLLCQTMLETEAGMLVFSHGEIGFAWRVGLGLLLTALAGLPAAAFVAAALTWSRRRHWLRLAGLLVGSAGTAATAGYVWLSYFAAPLVSEQHYSWRGWYAVWPVGVYVAGVVVLMAFLGMRGVRLGWRGIGWTVRRVTRRRASTR